MSEQQTEGRERVEAGEVKPKRRPPPPIAKRTDAEVEAILKGEKRNSKGGNKLLHTLSPTWQAAQARKAALAAGVIPGSGPPLGEPQENTQVATCLKPQVSASADNASQFLARQGLSLAAVLEHAPNAVDLLGKLVRGKLGGEKVPVGLRMQAAFKILDSAGINAQVGERIEAALKAPGGASLQSLAARLIEASDLAKKRQETGQKSGTDQPATPILPL